MGQLQLIEYKQIIDNVTITSNILEPQATQVVNVDVLQSNEVHIQQINHLLNSIATTTQQTNKMVETVVAKSHTLKTSHNVDIAYQ